MKDRAKKVVNGTKAKIKAIKNKFNILKNNLSERFSISECFIYVLKKIDRKISKYKNSDNRFSYILRVLLSSRVAIVLLIAIIILKTIFFYNNINLDELGTTIFLSLMFILLLICPLFFVKKDKNRFWAIMIYNIIFSVLLFVDNMYWEYSFNMISVSQILYVRYAEEIGNTLPYLLHFWHLLYFIDIPITLILWNIARKPLKHKKSKRLKNKGKRRVAFAIVYTIFIIHITKEPIAICNELMKEEPYLKLGQVETGSIYGYHYLDIYNTLNIKDTTKYKTYDEMIEDYKILDKYYKSNFSEEDLYGIAEGKNVIIVQLESIQNFVVNRKINGKEITPNLNKFINSNIEFTNMIMQSYSTTADSEYSVITSLYPLENGQAFSEYYTSIDNDIFDLYKNSGYDTYYMHGNVKEFWNRKGVYNRLNIDHTIFIDEFEDTSEMINGYLSDELFYKQAVDKIEDSEEPFLAFLVAASSHTPFELEGIQDKEKKLTIDVGEYKGVSFGNYLEAVNYADYAFGILIDELKEKGIYDDSVIIVYGDHYGMGMYDWDMELFIREINPNYNDVSKHINYANVLCGMKIPEITNKRIEIPVSKIDIKPTLLQICGIGDDFSLGKSMFSTKDYVCINNGNIVTDELYYYYDMWYDINSGEEINLDTLEDDKRKRLLRYVENMKLELDISSSIAINNLLK